MDKKNENFTDRLLKRESCRSYCAKPVSRDDLKKIVEAGRLTPSGCNAQPWKFIVVDEPEAKKRLCDALVVQDNATGCPWREQVPAFIVLVEQPAKLMPAAMKYYQNSQHFAQGDIGMAALNMCYAAMDLGLSSCILGMLDQQKMEKYFHIPHGQQVHTILAIGYSNEPNAAPRAKIRKPFDEVCSFNHW